LGTIFLKKFFLDCLLKYVAPVLVWLVLIFYLSSQPGLKAGVVWFWEIILRKLAHFGEYAVLFFLLHRWFHQGCSWSRGKAAGWAIALAWLYSFSDEGHQLLVAGRSARLVDVWVDLLGILFMAGWLSSRRSNQPLLTHWLSGLTVGLLLITLVGMIYFDGP